VYIEFLVRLGARDCAGSGSRYIGNISGLNGLIFLFLRIQKVFWYGYARGRIAYNTPKRRPGSQKPVRPWSGVFPGVSQKPAVLPNSCPQKDVPLPFFLFLNLLHSFPARPLQVRALRTRVGNGQKRLFEGVSGDGTGRP
jgi:hypothetical protein